MTPDWFCCPMLTVPGTNNKYIKQIKDVNVDSYFDLICKVRTLLFFLTRSGGLFLLPCYCTCVEYVLVPMLVPWLYTGLTSAVHIACFGADTSIVMVVDDILELREASVKRVRVLQILFVNHQDESQNNVIIYVWDGTDASPVHSNPL